MGLALWLPGLLISTSNAANGGTTKIPTLPKKVLKKLGKDLGNSLTQTVAQKLANDGQLFVTWTKKNELRVIYRQEGKQPLWNCINETGKNNKMYWLSFGITGQGDWKMTNAQKHKLAIAMRPDMFGKCSNAKCRFSSRPLKYLDPRKFQIHDIVSAKVEWEVPTQPRKVSHQTYGILLSKRLEGKWGKGGISWTVRFWRKATKGACTEETKVMSIEAPLLTLESDYTPYKTRYDAYRRCTRDWCTGNCKAIMAPLDIKIPKKILDDLPLPLPFSEDPALKRHRLTNQRLIDRFIRESLRARRAEFSI